MSNMEYLQWGYGVCRNVLSIEYEHGIFALGVGDRHHYHCWVGSEVLSDRPGGLDGPTQYSILNTLPLEPNPRNLGIIIDVGLGVRGAVRYTRGSRWSHSILNTQYFTLGP